MITSDRIGTRQFEQNEAGAHDTIKIRMMTFKSLELNMKFFIRMILRR